MKRFSITIFLLLIVSAVAFAQNQTLPKSCRNILDKNFRGWKFANISPEIQKFLRANSPRGNSKGNFITGDWNGDGKTDYAVLINHGSEILNDGTRLPRSLSVAFVSGGKDFRHFVIDTFGDYAAFQKNGTKAYDFETQSTVKFSNDAIFIGIWEKSGASYVWRKDRFIRFITSD